MICPICMNDKATEHEIKIDDHVPSTRICAECKALLDKAEIHSIKDLRKRMESMGLSKFAPSL